MSIFLPRYPRQCDECGRWGGIDHMCTDPGPSTAHSLPLVTPVCAGVWRDYSGAYLIEPSILLEVGVPAELVERVLQYVYDCEGVPTEAELDESRDLMAASLRRLRGAAELARENARAARALTEEPIVLDDLVDEERAA